MYWKVVVEMKSSNTVATTQKPIMHSFYMVLPSNVRNISGTNNQTGHYTTYLPKSLSVDKDKWKVAIVDISYVTSWFNVTMDTCAVIIRGKDIAETKQHIPLKHYSDVQSLVNAIMTILDASSVTSYIMYHNNRVVIYVQHGTSLTLHDMTAAMLGFRITHFDASTLPGEHLNTPYRATLSPNVHLPLQHLYIYSNLVEQVVVGDTYAPLLQVVPVQNGSFGTVQYHQFLNPLYMSLAMDDISVIEIKLCDDLGNIVKFAIGNVVIKLHFKQVSD
jgi:hypothetical protein